MLQYEEKIIIKKILPGLLSALNNEKLSPPILQTFIDLMQSKKKKMTTNVFKNDIWPKLLKLMQGKSMPAQTMYLLILHIKTFMEYLSVKEVTDHICPILLKAYECGNATLQSLAIVTSDYLAGKLDFVFTKNQMLPRILRLCQNKNANVQKDAVICLGKIYNILDKTTIQN